MPIQPRKITPSSVRPNVVRPSVVRPSFVQPAGVPQTVVPRPIPETVQMIDVPPDPVEIDEKDRPVDSSFIGSIGYENTSEGSGDVYVFMYKSNRTYVYQGVAGHVFEEFLRAPSKGKFYNANIKHNYTWHEVSSRVPVGVQPKAKMAKSINISSQLGKIGKKK